MNILRMSIKKHRRTPGLAFGSVHYLSHTDSAHLKKREMIILGLAESKECEENSWWQRVVVILARNTSLAVRTRLFDVRKL